MSFCATPIHALTNDPIHFSVQSCRLGCLRASYSAPKGEMTANIAAGRSDVHSAVRVVSLVLEGIPFPVARNEVTSEAVFKRLRVVKIVEDVDFVRITGADRFCSAFEVASIVASVYDIFFLTDADFKD